MGEIHELLPALVEAENAERKIASETEKVLDKHETTEAYNKVYIAHNEEDKAEEAGLGESKEMTTTVVERLEYETEFVARHLDAQLQRELANQVARANVVLPNGVELKDLPVTFLMYWEKWLQRKRDILSRVPTYDTTVLWESVPQAEMRGVWRAIKPITGNRTRKTKVPITMAPATKEHKEQVQLLDKEEVIGHYETTRHTGKLTPAQKHALLKFLDDTIVAVKKAKAIANKTAVPNEQIGKEFWQSLMQSLEV